MNDPQSAEDAPTILPCDEPAVVADYLSCDANAHDLIADILFDLGEETLIHLAVNTPIAQRVPDSFVRAFRVKLLNTCMEQIDQKMHEDGQFADKVNTLLGNLLLEEEDKRRQAMDAQDMAWEQYRVSREYEVNHETH